MQKVVKQLYARDIRRQFTTQEDHWLSRQISVHAERVSTLLANHCLMSPFLMVLNDFWFLSLWLLWYIFEVHVPYFVHDGAILAMCMY